MDILQIVGVGIIAAVLAVILKAQKKEFAIHISIAAGILIFLFVLGKLVSIVNVLQDMANKIKLDFAYLTTVLKIIGIAYVAEFGSQVCKDAGEGAIASKIEFGGKIIIMTLAIPIVMALLNMIIEIIP
ncbi:MAG: stage III sporulation protein AD [Clostridia bacterium]